MTNQEFAAEINSALIEFGVSHFNLLTPIEAEAKKTGKSITSGIRSQKTTEGIEILAVRRGSPAYEAKLKAGDVIFSINNKTPLSLDDLDGNVGETKVFEVRRQAEKSSFRIEYREWKMPPDSLVWLNSEIALITVQSFSDANYSRKLIDSLFEEAAARARILVVDLRGNGGGNAVNVEHLAGKVLPERTVLGTFIEKADVERFIKANNRKNGTLEEIALQAVMIQRASQNKTKHFTGDLLVITDRSNASGAELFPFAVQEQKRGQIIGGKTRGKVLLGQNVRLTNGFELQVVIADFLTSSGKRIEGNGVIPDVAIESEVLGEDAKLFEFIRQLTKKEK